MTQPSSGSTNAQLDKENRKVCEYRGTMNFGNGLTTGGLANKESKTKGQRN